MKVSVLIPLYNKEEFIAETIESVLAQTWSNIEIIVVDDGSTDNSYNIAQQYTSQKIKLYKQENKGAPSARNFAFLKSTGDYIQYLDADDLMTRNKIEEQLKTLSDYSYQNDIVVFSSWMEFENNETLDFSKRRNAACYKNYTPAYNALIDYWKLSFPSIPYHTYLVPRNIIQTVGKWRIDLQKNQDSEFFARILAYASKLVFCQKPIVFYRNVSDSISKPNNTNKIKSEFIVAKLITTIILSKTRNKDALYACSLYYSELAEARYPLNKFFFNDIVNDMRNFGLYIVTEHRGKLFKILFAFFDWKNTIKILKIIRKVVTIQVPI